ATPRTRITGTLLDCQAYTRPRQERQDIDVNRPSSSEPLRDSVASTRRSQRVLEVGQPSLSVGINGSRGGSARPFAMEATTRSAGFLGDWAGDRRSGPPEYVRPAELPPVFPRAGYLAPAGSRGVL